MNRTLNYEICGTSKLRRASKRVLLVDDFVFLHQHFEDNITLLNNHIAA